MVVGHGMLSSYLYHCDIMCGNAVCVNQCIIMLNKVFSCIQLRSVSYNFQHHPSFEIFNDFHIRSISL